MSTSAVNAYSKANRTLSGFGHARRSSKVNARARRASSDAMISSHRFANALLASSSALVLACASTTEVSSSAIVEGSVAPDHDAVVLVMGPAGQCSGTLISAHDDGTGVVLTAAHCVDASPLDRYFVIIADDYSAPGPVRLNVTSVHRHPGYPEVVSVHDIALLGVSGVPAGASVLSPLRADEDRLSTGAGYLAVGYGTRNPAGTVRTTIRHAAQVTVASLAFNRIHSRWGDGATCGGDSGGPLLLEVDGELRVVGVDVVVDGECDTTVNMGADRVAYYEDFIASVVDDRPPGCSTCRQAAGIHACTSAHNECGDDGCSDYRSCIEGCFGLDPACTNECVRRHGGGTARFAETVGACLCDACAEECGDECAGALIGELVPEPDAGAPDAAMPDAGAGDASVSDAATPEDASLLVSDGGAPAPRATCGCTMVGSPRGSHAAIGSLLSLALVYVRRRRSRKR